MNQPVLELSRLTCSWLGDWWHMQEQGLSATVAGNLGCQCIGWWQLCFIASRAIQRQPTKTTLAGAEHFSAAQPPRKACCWPPACFVVWCGDIPHFDVWNIVIIIVFRGLFSEFWMGCKINQSICRLCKLLRCLSLFLKLHLSLTKGGTSKSRWACMNAKGKVSKFQIVTQWQREHM